jgi:hypothetical protein
MSHKKIRRFPACKVHSQIITKNGCKHSISKYKFVRGVNNVYIYNVVQPFLPEAQKRGLNK